MTRRRKRIAVRIAVAAIALLLGDQVVHFAAMGDGYFLGRRIAPFDPPLFWAPHTRALEQIDDHLQRGGPGPRLIGFDADLGWCHTPQSATESYAFDWSGSRIGFAPLPRTRTAGVTRIAAFGCSFTLGAEVGAEESWCALLDHENDSFEIANMGVVAYGLDQALMRFRRDAAQVDPDEVWLGVFPSALVRVLTTYRPAQRHWGHMVVFKPRFELGEDGRLVRVPCPVTSLADLSRVVHDQGEFFRRTHTSDFWVGRSPAAYSPRGSHWSHHFATTRLIATLQERGGREASGWLADPDSPLTRLADRIVRDMSAEVSASGLRFRALILPGQGDLAEHARSGKGYWSDLTELWRRDGIEVIDVSRALLDAGALDDASYWAPDTHYSAPANRVVADALAAELAR